MPFSSPHHIAQRCAPRACDIGATFSTLSFSLPPSTPRAPSPSRALDSLQKEVSNISSLRSQKWSGLFWSFPASAMLIFALFSFCFRLFIFDPGLLELDLRFYFWWLGVSWWCLDAWGYGGVFVLDRLRFLDSGLLGLVSWCDIVSCCLSGLFVSFIVLEIWIRRFSFNNFSNFLGFSRNVSIGVVRVCGSSWFS